MCPIEERQEDNKQVVETVKDEKLLKALVEYFQKRFEVIA